jgi:hypothetical protein
MDVLVTIVVGGVVGWLARIPVRTGVESLPIAQLTALGVFRRPALR